MPCKDLPDFLLQRQGGAVELNASGDPLLYSFSTHAASMSLFADVAMSYSCKLSFTWFNNVRLIYYFEMTSILLFGNTRIPGIINDF